MSRSVLCVCGAAVVLYAAATTAPASLTAPAAGTCAGARRTVETLTDRAARSVSLSPRATTVSALRQLGVPSRLGNTRVAGIETTSYRVTVRLVQMWLEPDGDFRLTVVDPKTHETMLAEFPAPACIRAAPAEARRLMSAARSALVAACGRPDRGSVTRVGGPATITAVGFVEPAPRQADAAPNGVALGPVLGFRTAQCLLGAG